MRVTVVIIVCVATLQLAQSQFLECLLLSLPFGPIVATNGIAGFKAALGTFVVSFLSKHVVVSYDDEKGIVAPPLHEEQAALSGGSGFREPNTAVPTTEELAAERVRDVLSSVAAPQHKTDVLFLFLKQTVDSDCVSRLVCESSADPLHFGRVGNATMHFFDGETAVKTRPASVFVAAAQAGRTRGLQSCFALFPKCTADLPYILSIVRLMGKKGRHRGLELAFVSLKENEDCVPRLACERAADALRMGRAVPGKVFHFASGDSARQFRAEYKKAANVGRFWGLKRCAVVYPKCSADLPRVLSIARLV
ncbi:uncharacterized protein LOC144152388 [Haemaphysalis longicornis]